MTAVDCKWIEDHLEALFGDSLSGQESQSARTHINQCRRCSEQVSDLKAIDPLIHRLFRENMIMARGPKPQPIFYRAGALAAVGLAMIVLVVSMQMSPRVPTSVAPAVQKTAATPPSSDAPAVVKVPDGVPADRAKPDVNAQPNGAVVPSAPVHASGPAPDFLITDPAGYSRSLADYKGRVLIVGVWSAKDARAIENLEHIYKSLSADTSLRIVGVSETKQARPANTTFPAAYNQGSKLLGVTATQFVVVDATGAIRLRGSLADESNRVVESIRSTIDQIRK